MQPPNSSDDSEQLGASSGRIYPTLEEWEVWNALNGNKPLEEREPIKWAAWDEVERKLAEMKEQNPNQKTGSTGFYEAMKPYNDFLENKDEPLPIPTHNYQLLKDHRQKKYEYDLAKHVDERSNNGFADTHIDIILYRIQWLEDELGRNVESWLSSTYANGKPKRIYRVSDVIEIKKYKMYVLDEIKAAEDEIPYLRDQLEQPVISSNTQTSIRAENKGEIPKSPLANSFKRYIVEEYRDVLILFITTNYKEEKPQSFGYLLFALDDLDLLQDKLTGLSITDLYQALKLTFDVKWSRQALNYNISQLNKPDTTQRQKISQHGDRVKLYLNLQDEKP